VPPIIHLCDSGVRWAEAITAHVAVTGHVHFTPADVAVEQLCGVQCACGTHFRVPVRQVTYSLPYVKQYMYSSSDKLKAIQNLVERGLRLRPCPRTTAWARLRATVGG
jgi:hypothetical protein